MTSDKNLSKCKKICPSMNDKHFSFILGQIFLHLDKFLSYVTHLSLWNYYEGQKNYHNRKLAFSHTKWVKILVNSSKWTSLCKVISWDPSNVTLLHEKARQMKKTFCFNFCAYHCLWKNVSTSDLSCPQLPRLKKGNLGNISQPRPVHFSASAYGLGLKNAASSSKNFSSIPFFQPR